MRSQKETKVKVHHASCPELEEEECIALAMSTAKRQLAEGTASPLVIAHFLRLGSTREKKEQEKLERQNELLAAQAEQIREAETSSALYAEALTAFRSYQGNSDNDEGEDYADL